MSVRTRIIVPHRGLEAAKTRLSTVLDPAGREALARRLLERVLSVARQACDDVVVISPAAALDEVVSAAGARLVLQHGMGLNKGLDEARAAGLTDGVELLVVLHGDLPNLAVDDVVALRVAVDDAEADQRPAAAIAPDRRGSGTNGLALRPPSAIGFRFGVGSFDAHRAEARRAGIEPVIVERDGLAFDLDTPEDLARWLALGDAA